MRQQQYEEYHLKSYEQHQNKQFDNKLVETWSRKDTVDAWRHSRMYKCLDPLLKSYPKQKWLTVGDGRYGNDAHYISEFGNKVLATDISENQLKKALKDGYVNEYRVENAENLSFQDQSFDFVFCKESYHHFPRPMVALYEMLRVARTAVMLIEPNDDKIATPQTSGIAASSSWLWMASKNKIKRILGKKPYYDQGRYEPSGNYIYTLSVRELEKVSLGMNFPVIAFKGLNDHYIEGAEVELLSENGPILNEIKRVLNKKDHASIRGWKPWGLLVAIIFKEKPNTHCSKALVEAGFWMNELQRNPYADDRT